ncbi:MAG TPA: hypothetical protein VFH61_08570, partial [Thermoleophilia bacterium]|nr:hypothetical protein [Thermoleophilia bacterium]
EDMGLDELGDFLDEMVDTSQSLEDLAHLIEKYIGVEFLRDSIVEARGDETSMDLARAIGQGKYGETQESLQRRKGMGLQNTFGEHDWSDDIAFAESMLDDSLDRRPRGTPVRTEANMPAPKSGRRGPDGRSQLNPKSKFSRGYYPGPGQDYKGDPANMPSDREAQAAATRSTAGVSGPGYADDGREEIDVRQESRGNRPALRRPAPRGRGDVNGNTMEEIMAGIEDQSYPAELLER